MNFSRPPILKTVGGVTALVVEDLLDEGILVAFTTRLGGVSEAPYSSLNFGFHVGDSPRNVIENRSRVCRALGLSPARLTCSEQVHGPTVEIITEEERGRGSMDLEGAVGGADGMITAVPETPLAIFAADCVPIAVVDPIKRVVAGVHAGWRGTYAGIAEAAVAKMRDGGSDPANLIAYIGPAIGSCCYEVGDEAAGSFAEVFGPSVVKGSGHLDLKLANRIALGRAGVSPDRILDPGLCTSCRNGLFFSYRAEGGTTGRQALVVCLIG